MTNQPTKEEQIRKTQERLYELNGLERSGFIGTCKTVYYLTLGYYFNYDTYKIYRDSLNFVIEKQKEEQEENE